MTWIPFWRLPKRVASSIDDDIKKRASRRKRKSIKKEEDLVLDIDPY
jgi:hypothetical protein